MMRAEFDHLADAVCQPVGGIGGRVIPLRPRAPKKP